MRLVPLLRVLLLSFNWRGQHETKPHKNDTTQKCLDMGFVLAILAPYPDNQV